MVIPPPRRRHAVMRGDHLGFEIAQSLIKPNAGAVAQLVLKTIQEQNADGK